MASSDDKLTADAKRAKDRSFAGYLTDRALGRADFSKAAPAQGAQASQPPVMGGSNPANAEAIKAAGFKKGGMVRRGYGRARGA